MFLTYDKKNNEKFVFSQKVKLLDPTNVSQTHLNMALAQSLSYNTTLYH